MGRPGLDARTDREAVAGPGERPRLPAGAIRFHDLDRQRPGVEQPGSGNDVVGLLEQGPGQVVAEELGGGDGGPGPVGSGAQIDRHLASVGRDRPVRAREVRDDLVA